MKGLVAVLVVLAIWTAGLLAFADRVARLTPATPPDAADGIVALTGASDLRLETATRLLEDGRGQRMLVSGVNKKVSRAQILGVTHAMKPVFDCCIDLGFEALDTLGNAHETAQWARSLRYRSLILVTSDFHMPRALLELKAAMPEEDIRPYPVATAGLDARHWWQTGEGARRMAFEYSKYLGVLTREAILSLGPRDAPAPEQSPS